MIKRTRKTVIRALRNYGYPQSVAEETLRQALNGNPTACEIVNKAFDYSWAHSLDRQLARVNDPH